MAHPVRPGVLGGHATLSGLTEPARVDSPAVPGAPGRLYGPPATNREPGALG
ncbi:hypothetical protein ACIP96_28915 [Streptomyces nigra]|uniref:hypothetical protein n=1 Tax=Streptomyces nigra TaxID=1827580 RepID=UPI0037F3B0EC